MEREIRTENWFSPETLILVPINSLAEKRTSIFNPVIQSL